MVFFFFFWGRRHLSVGTTPGVKLAELVRDGVVYVSRRVIGFVQLGAGCSQRLEVRAIVTPLAWPTATTMTLSGSDRFSRVRGGAVVTFGPC